MRTETTVSMLCQLSLSTLGFSVRGVGAWGTDFFCVLKRAQLGEGEIFAVESPPPGKWHGRGLWWAVGVHIIATTALRSSQTARNRIPSRSSLCSAGGGSERAGELRRTLSARRARRQLLAEGRSSGSWKVERITEPESPPESSLIGIINGVGVQLGHQHRILVLIILFFTVFGKVRWAPLAGCCTSDTCLR